MYSLVMMVAMTAGPDVPQDALCPVTPSKYGCCFWSTHSFYDCCAPARYGWVTCYTKGFGYVPSYPGCGCAPSSVPLYTPSPCCCNPCGTGYGGGGKGGGFCGCGWPIGHTPAYYTSVLGCPPHLCAPPYACGTNCKPCCTTQFAFDTGLAGLSAGAGYAGFGGYGNFGMYAAVPMLHKPTTADLPPFPRPDPTTPTLSGGVAPMPPLPMAPMPPAPMGVTPPAPPETPKAAPETPKAAPETPKVPDGKKEDPKKSRLHLDRPAPATVILSVPAGANVWVETERLTSTGRDRTFRTPALPPNEEYVYTIKAVLIVAGKEEVETLRVKVTAGEISRASFEQLYARAATASPSVVTDQPRR